jgi:NADPH2:quinone reductase
MRAYIVPEFGAPGTIAERPIPDPGEGQLLVRVKAAAVNAMDPMITAGMLKDWMEHRLPLTPGSDYAGTVAGLGPGVSDFAVGDEVFGDVGKPYAGEGSFGEYVTASAALAFRRPPELPVEVAAALPRAGGTALAEVDAARVVGGDTVLIVGAAGGVGGFATQLAARRGARVIALTGADKADEVRDLGAAEVVDYDAPDVADRVRRVAPDGVAALIDNYHDAAGLVALAGLVRSGGMVISPVAMGGDQALAGLPVTFQLVQAAVDRAGELAEMVVRGELTARVGTVPLSQAGEALERQSSRQVHGKIVVLVDQG